MRNTDRVPPPHEFRARLERLDGDTPGGVWRRALAEATNADEIMAIAEAAQRCGRIDVARRALEPLAHRGKAPTMRKLGTVLSEEEPSAAQHQYGEAAKRGDVEAMVKLAERLKERVVWSSWCHRRWCRIRGPLRHALVSYLRGAVVSTTDSQLDCRVGYQQLTAHIGRKAYVRPIVAVIELPV